MGLDMYLTAERYFGDWQFNDEAERSVYRTVMNAVDLDGFRCEGHPAATVEVYVFYWRKANAIHKWFVDNCQNGVDECQTVSVSDEQLTVLRDLCRQVLQTRDATPLPPQAGFFFGSAEVDKYYWQDLAYTAEGLTELLEDKRFENWQFRYHSSW